MLQRSDLPDDPQVSSTAVDTARWDTSEGFPGTRPRRGRLATVLSTLAAVLVALAVAVTVWVATETVGRSVGTTAAVIVGVPALLLLAALLASFAGRRRSG